MLNSKLQKEKSQDGVVRATHMHSSRAGGHAIMKELRKKGIIKNAPEPKIRGATILEPEETYVPQKRTCQECGVMCWFKDMVRPEQILVSINGQSQQMSGRHMLFCQSCAKTMGLKAKNGEK